MSNLFYDFQTLKQGTQQMSELLKHLYSSMQTRLVHPMVQPGFLRNQFAQSPPQQGKPISQVITQTQTKIYPGTMLWQSPRFFGYFPSAISVSSIIAQMFATTFHSPGFNYAVSPSHTQLQNIQMDWCGKVLGLPQIFLLKNQGGGIINNSTTQSVLVTVHAAKRKKMEQENITMIDTKILKFVGYYSQMAHNGTEKGLLMKEIYYRRAVKVQYNKKTKNYQINIQNFKELLEKDIQQGLIPFWFGATYGSTLSAGIDLTQQLVNICRQHKIWLNVDAAYLGSTWICQQFRPHPYLLQHVDSITINFSKVLLSGTGGSLMFIRDKSQLNRSFNGTAQFSFYENKFTGKNDVVDYKDWIFGLGRRNNAIKLFFMFQHYGVNNLRKYIRETERKAINVEKWVQENKELFQMYCRRFGVVCWRVKDKNGNVSDKLTKKVCDQVKNIKQGYLSPGMFKGVHMVRLVIGNYHSDQKTIMQYLEKIKQKSIELRESFNQKQQN